MIRVRGQCRRWLGTSSNQKRWHHIDAWQAGAIGCAQEGSGIALQVGRPRCLLSCPPRASEQQQGQGVTCLGRACCCNESARRVRMPFRHPRSCSGDDETGGAWWRTWRSAERRHAKCRGRRSAKAFVASLARHCLRPVGARLFCAWVLCERCAGSPHGCCSGVGAPAVHRDGALPGRRPVGASGQALRRRGCGG